MTGELNMRYLIFSLITLMTVVHAQPLDATDLSRLPYTELFRAESAPGENLDAFAVRITPLLVEHPALPFLTGAHP
jgi:hypothetical protein